MMTHYFDTVVLMLAASIPLGDVAETRGYFSKGDGGGNSYQVVQDDTGEHDGGSYIDSTVEPERQYKGQFPNGHNIKQFGATGEKSQNATEIFVSYNKAFPDQELRFPKGEYRGNFKVEDSSRIVGAGVYSTVLYAHSNSEPIIEFSSKAQTQENQKLPIARFSGGRDFGVEGEGDATIGVQIGGDLYVFGGENKFTNVGNCAITNLDVQNCVNNIVVKRAVGISLKNVISEDAKDSALKIPRNAVITMLRCESCKFRQSETGLKLEGGAVMNFEDCVIESNKHLGLLFQRTGASGARQTSFQNCWFEGNANRPQVSATSNPNVVGGIFIDMSDFKYQRPEVTSPAPPYAAPTYLRFENCIIDNDRLVGTGDDGPRNPAVTIDRGTGIEFVRCAFDNLDRDSHQFKNSVSFDTAHSDAKLIDCGKINEPPSPAVYSNFPPRVRVSGPADIDSGNERYKQDKYLGFEYEYTYRGQTYSNRTDPILEVGPLANEASLEINDMDVTGLGTIACNTEHGSVMIHSLLNGNEGQVLRVIKLSPDNTVQIAKDLVRGSQDIVLAEQEGYTLVYYHDAWRASEKVASTTAIEVSHRPEMQVLDVRGVSTILCDTENGSVDIKSLTGGVDGQVVRIIKKFVSHEIILRHNLGSGKIYTPDNAPVTLKIREGATLVQHQGIWYSSSK